MADNYQPKKPVVRAPKSEIADTMYGDYRIVQTDDPAWVASGKDSYGFTNPTVFVVLDQFDEIALPVGMSSHFTVYDAIAAIEMRDKILPAVKGSTWSTSALFEFNRMQHQRRHAWITELSLAKIRKLCQDADAFDDNPCEDVIKELNELSSLLHAAK